MGQEQSWDRWWGQHARVYTGEEQQANGSEYVEQFIAELREFAPNFYPGKIIDFGCGLGRTLLPLSQAFPQAQIIGVDISDVALAQANARLTAGGIEAEFVNSSTADIPSGYDLVHSFIVFQHIPAKIGLRRFAELVEKLNPNGIGALHITYAQPGSLSRRVLYRVRKWLPGAQALANLIATRPLPFVQMNAYPIGRLIRLLQDNGCHRVSMSFSDHSGHLGVRLMFQKVRLPSL